MDDFLTPVFTTKVKRSQDTKSLLQEIRSAVSDRNSSLVVDSPDKALEVLNEQPDFETVEAVLNYISNASERKDGFHLMLPDPVAANIVYQLINTTIPDYWQILQESGTNLKHLLRCLSNPSGIGNIITRLRTLIADCRNKKPAGNNKDTASHIKDLLQVLEKMLRGDQFMSQVWADVEVHGKNATQKKMMWKEFVTQVASGRIVSIAAEAEDVLKEEEKSMKAIWLANGNEYASWIGRNIAILSKETENSEGSALALVEVCSKALNLGYTDHILRSMLSILVDTDSITAFSSLLRMMKIFEQRKYLTAIVTALSKQYLNTVTDSKENSPPQSSRFISGVAALINELVKNSDTLKEHLITSLTKSPISALVDYFATRRSTISTIAQDEDHLHTLLENSLKLFGDSFYIKHTPLLQQEALAQTLAITCGYVHRSQPMFLTMMAKSTHHISGMSNRIGSSSPRARFLGIAVGMAISKLVDKPDNQLRFDLEGDEASEAQWYQYLTQTTDKLGNISDLKSQAKAPQSKQAGGKPKPASAPKATPKSGITDLTTPRIVEIVSSDEDDDDDLIPYTNPDSDPEDTSPDPTEINRNKSTAPVYIRTLIVGLRDTEVYDHHSLALSTAASLIRRKANFGTEVADHIEELATILVGLNDTFEIDGFEEKRRDAMIAVLLARPGPMAQWFARSLFAGDYSLTQRTAILTTLGLGARELAGFKDTETPTAAEQSFPSKHLPPHLHALYSAPPTQASPLARLTSSTTQALLSPLAAQAVNSLSGPAILKVDSSRTFSRKMEVEKRRSKPLPNALSKLVAEDFIFPLTGRWWLATRSDPDSIFTTPHLLPSLLQTLTLLLHAAGPHTPTLPHLTTDLFALLLACRVHATSDRKTLSALLQTLLTLLDINGSDTPRLASEHGGEVLETLAWARAVFDELPAGGKAREGEGEDEKTRVLAAGVVVRCQEVAEKYQRRMVGRLMDY